MVWTDDDGPGRAGPAGRVARAARALVGRVARNRAVSRLRDAAPDRGDVPGWVLVTLMTAGLVSVLWFVAGDLLVTVFQNAVSAVVPSGP